MSGFNRLSLGWRLILATGLLAGLGQVGWAAFGGGGLISTLGMAGLATLVAVLVAASLASAAATRRTLAGLARSVEALGTGRYDQPLAAATDDPDLAAVAKALDGVRRGLAETEARQAREAAERALAEAEAQRQLQDAEGFAEDQATAVATLGQGMARLARGDLVSRLDETAFPGQARQAPRDFNAAVDSLRATMAAILSTAQGLRAGCGDLDQTADDLARRTQDQAAGLEKTAAALGQITATVQRSRDGAERARAITANAKTTAERSGEVVREAVAAMGGIESSAQSITQIIGVIDEIAFQTNLLALNAGVEAARAGDAGRGFAVVAQEVRALAQRSAQAAKEIKGLIRTSSEQVGKGVKLVDETGQTLAQILGQVAEINDLVGEIAASSKEQASGLAAVNTAVGQIDQATRRNAALVDQSGAASRALTADAAALEQLIERFEVGIEPRSRPGQETPVAPRREAFRERYVQGANALKVEPRSRPGDW